MPGKSPYDYGSSYLRIFSTYIPRVIWPSKPLYGRKEWISAWMAGSEFPRDETFTGPAIGLLGASHLNGGAIATAIVMAGLALALPSAGAGLRGERLSERLSTLLTPLQRSATRVQG